ncbi:hypothetical protein [Brevundimonas sp.]
MHDLEVAFRRKPVATWLAIVAVVVVFGIFGEYAAGFIDGLVAGFSDAA